MRAAGSKPCVAGGDDTDDTIADDTIALTALQQHAVMRDRMRQQRVPTGCPAIFE